MESIRILQNTYENLYVLAKPIRDFLQEKLPLVQKDWHWLVDDILQKTLHKYDSADFEKLKIVRSGTFRAEIRTLRFRKRKALESDSFKGCKSSA